VTQLSVKERKSSRAFLVSALLSALILAVLISVIFFGAANLQWDTRLLPNDHGWLSSIFLLLALCTFLHGCWTSEWDGFSPRRLYYSAWFALLALGCLRLTTAEPPFTVRFWVVVASGLLGFFLGGRLAQGHIPGNYRIALEKLKEYWEVRWQPSRALFLAGFLFGASFLAFIYSYLHAGMLPLLADDPNWARFNFGVNSYVQRFVISFYLIIFLGYVGIVHLRKYRVAFLTMSVLSFAVITLLTARVFLVSAIWMVIILFHYGRRRMTPRVALSVVLIAYPLAKVAVDVKRFYEDPTFNRILDQIDFPQKLRLFGPDYIYFSATLQTLDNLTHMIPGELKYTHGWYIGYPVRVFWTSRQGEGFRGRLDDLFWERSRDWSPFPSVTATYLGWPYADFGIPGVFGYSLIFGWISLRVYESMRKEPTFWRVFLYSQLSFAIVLSLYSSYLTLFDVYWNLLVVGLFDRLASNPKKLANEGVVRRPALGF
jgi:hypothetical protein